MTVFLWLLLLLTACSGFGQKTPPVPNFDELVNETVLEAAVKEYIEELDNTVPDLNWAGDENVRDAHFYARKAAFEHYFSIHGINPIYRGDTAKWHYDWTDIARNVVRAKLKDPKVLQETYNELIPTALPMLLRSRNRNMIQKHLDRTVLPSFTKPVSAELLAAYRGQAKCWEEYLDAIDGPSSPTPSELRPEDCALRSAYSASYQHFARMAASEGFPDDLYFLQWRLRRYAEGGDELVQAWADIVQNVNYLLVMQQVDDIWQQNVKAKPAESANQQ